MPVTNVQKLNKPTNKQQQRSPARAQAHTQRNENITGEDAA